LSPPIWPSDHGRRVGRVVYPLADPATGRVASALGRLCTDPGEEWSESTRTAFKAVKQRKLTGCPVGAWPYQSIVAAVKEGRSLVLVEGPADALALLRRAPDLPVVAINGTANVVLALDDVVLALDGAVLALDGVVLTLAGDGPGAAVAAEEPVSRTCGRPRKMAAPSGAATASSARNNHAWSRFLPRSNCVGCHESTGPSVRCATRPSGPCLCSYM